MTNISNQVLEMQASPIRKLSPLANKAKKAMNIIKLGLDDYNKR